VALQHEPVTNDTQVVHEHCVLQRAQRAGAAPCGTRQEGQNGRGGLRISRVLYEFSFFLCNDLGFDRNQRWLGAGMIRRCADWNHPVLLDWAGVGCAMGIGILNLCFWVDWWMGGWSLALVGWG